MEPLNLQIHEPGEFEGKSVSVNGADYVIGSELGRGAERIVHKLFNTRSGLCVHVIKLWRDPRDARFWGPAGRAKLNAQMRRDPKLGKIIPISLYFEAHGGPFELQDFINGYEYARETPATSALMEKGATLMNQGDFAGAKSTYSQILGENRFHTIALINLAAAHASAGDYNQASEIASIAARVEPNCVLYRTAQIQYYGSGGNLSAALEFFNSFKSAFPYIHDIDDYAIRVYLMTGDPENAGRLLAEGILSDTRLAELKSEIAAAASAKAKASTLAAQARDGLMDGKKDNKAALSLLEAAHATYDKDPLLSLNLGLAAGRVGDFKRALPLLLSTLQLMPLGMQKYCQANLAFNLIRAGMLPQAMMMLEGTLGLLTLAGTRQVTDLNDLPGVAIWVSDGQVIEERIQSAAELVNYAIQNCSEREAVTDDVRKLAALYNQAAAG